MAGLKSSEITSQLGTIRDKVDCYERRFQRRPLYALWVSAEGPARNWDAAQIRVEEAAWYLQVRPEHVTAVGESEYRNMGDREPWSPFFAYLPRHTRNASLAKRVQDVPALIVEQVTAMNVVCAGLEGVMTAFPKRLQEAYCFPHTTCWEANTACWWKVLFHLATHYPTAFLSVKRSRWVNCYDGLPEHRFRRSSSQLDTPIPAHR